MSSLLEALNKGILTSNAEETIAIGEALSKELPSDTSLALYGDLGVGKTTFVKGLAKGLNIAKNITSPTFNLFSIYKGDKQLIHLDAYRLSPEQSIETLMIEDFLCSPYLCVIEWPDNVPELLNENTLKLELSIQANSHQHFIQHI
ncbi:MAG: tRNA (adenosine(37)-N6)-threonylcarbamoyltransferase complex ATPase subunit type 1 TsaE [Verrucomicrobia bacterium]|nr:tRNA (adenosine(37)-N6)-threonylcarbamoyltransferase complex ATPase subunit type 1 TsaE [Verrucomicrobiota bacterium]